MRHPDLTPFYEIGSIPELQIMRMEHQDCQVKLDLWAKEVGYSNSIA